MARYYNSDLYVRAKDYKGIYRNPTATSQDSADGINAALADIRGTGKILLLESGTYYINKPIRMQDTWGYPGGNGNGAGSHDGRGVCRMMGDMGTAMPVIKINPDATVVNAKFKTGTGMPMINVYKDDPTATTWPTAVSDAPWAYSSYLAYIKCDTSGYASAYGVEFLGHQWCAMEYIEVVATGSKGGVTFVPGTSCSVHDIKVTGGEVCFALCGSVLDGNVATGDTPSGITIINSENGIGLDLKGYRGASAFMGLYIEGNGTPVRIGENDIFKGHAEFTNMHIKRTTAGVGISNTTNRHVSIRNSYFQKVDKICDNATGLADYTGDATKIWYVKEYTAAPTTLAQIANTGNGTPGATYDVVSYVNGVKSTLTPFISPSNGEVSSVPANLIEIGKLPVIDPFDDTQCVFMSKAFDGKAAIVPSGTTNQAPAIQNRMDRASALGYKTVVFDGPVGGLFGLGATLTIPKNMKVFFPPLWRCALTATDAFYGDATTETPLITTTSDVDDACQLWYPAFLIEFEQDKTTRRFDNWITAIHWKAGWKSVTNMIKWDIVNGFLPEKARAVVKFSGANCGGRHFGIMTTSKPNGEPVQWTNGARTFNDNYRRLLVTGVGGPIVFPTGINAEAPGWSTTTIVAPPTTEFLNSSNVLINGFGKIEHTKNPHVQFKGLTNAYVGLTCSMANSAGTYFKIVSPCNLQMGFVLNQRGTGNVITETGFTTTDPPSRDTPEVIGRYLRGTAFSHTPFDIDWNGATIVLPGNNAPVSNAASLKAVKNTAKTFLASEVMVNDSDPDGDTITLSSVTAVSNCTVSLSSGNVSFTPTTDFVGNATFTKIVTDGTDVSGSATVTVAVEEPVGGTDSTVPDTVERSGNATYSELKFVFYGRDATTPFSVARIRAFSTSTSANLLTSADSLYATSNVSNKDNAIDNSNTTAATMTDNGVLTYMFTTPAEIFRVAVTLDDADVSPKAIGVYGVRYLTGEPVLLSVIDATQAAAGDVLTVDVFQYAGEKSALLKTLRRAVRQS